MKDQTGTSQDTFAVYVSGPDRLEAALAGLAGDEMDWCLEPGSWSIRQIVQHLADGDANWGLFMKMALGAPGAQFQPDWYPGNDAWAATMGYAALPVDLALSHFRAQRAYTGALIQRMPERMANWITLTDADRQQEQQVTVAVMIAIVAEHVLEHVREIEKIRREHGR